MRLPEVYTLLHRKNVTEAGFLRTIGDCQPGKRHMTHQTLQSFLGKRDPSLAARAPSSTAPTVFLEKRRLKDAKPKSGRKNMEEVWDEEGLPIENKPDGYKEPRRGTDMLRWIAARGS